MSLSPKRFVLGHHVNAISHASAQRHDTILGASIDRLESIIKCESTVVDRIQIEIDARKSWSTSR